MILNTKFIYNTECSVFTVVFFLTSRDVNKKFIPTPITVSNIVVIVCNEFALQEMTLYFVMRSVKIVAYFNTL